MTTRRDFLAQTLPGVFVPLSVGAGAFSETAQLAPVTSTGPRIRRLHPRDETITRYLRMHGDNWHMTWAKNDLQYTSMCDGYGEFELPAGLYNSRLMAVEGNPQSSRFHDVAGYPDFAPIEGATRYYNFGVIALDCKIFQFLSTWPVPLVGNSEGLRFVGVKIIYSDDEGATWRNQDGSTPVVWEGWGERHGKNMLFYNEPNETFSMLSVLQMGRNYSDNKDGYVYIYAPNGNTEGTMNQLVMLRVPKDKILDRQAYEYYAGMTPNANATWSRNIDRRAIVHTFPTGWVNQKIHPWCWLPSVTYNAPLGLYMMANWATAPGPAPEEKWFAAPSYLGFWMARTPWGPWTQVYESRSWTPGGDLNARCYSPIISPKWIAKDGKSFWLVWTDFQSVISQDEMKRRAEEINKLCKGDKWREYAKLHRESAPYYTFNIQRFVLELS